MVESKMHEPTSSGFDDPNEWSEQDLKDWLKEVCFFFHLLLRIGHLLTFSFPLQRNIDFGHHPNRMELLAMVESKMHEPK